MKTVRNLTLSVLVAVGFLGVTAAPAGAIDIFPACGSQSSSKVCKARSSDKADGIVKNIVSTLLWALGILSAIMIVVGGIKYTTSNGDANKVQSAKNTVMYAIVGLVVAILAYAIVGFVIDSLL